MECCPWLLSAPPIFSKRANLIGSMRTRSGLDYPKPETGKKRKRSREEENSGRKKQQNLDFFDSLPDDLVLSILCKLSSSAESPSDLVNILMTCKRMGGLGLNPVVLSKVSEKSLSIRARNWSESAHQFLKQCVGAGSLEAAYFLGMVEFYCLENRPAGAALMAKAAMGSHAVALYSLAIIQFNGSGGSKNHKDLRAGAALCARSAYLGHVDALRELGHCLQDGYGIRRNIPEGRRFLFGANARELAAANSASASATKLRWQTHHLLSDFGGDVPTPEVPPANRFMLEWFASSPVDSDRFRSCSYSGCGRPESRKHEFRRCSVCGNTSYCSRACQALHWKLEHKHECKLAERRLDDAGNIAGAGGVNI